MKIIKRLSKNIDCELEAAECDIMDAIMWREEHPEIAKAFFSASQTHLDIIKLFHDQVVAFIAAYRKEHGDPPADMMTLYNYEHERHIEKAAAIRNLQDLYNKNY